MQNQKISEQPHRLRSTQTQHKCHLHTLDNIYEQNIAEYERQIIAIATTFRWIRPQTIHVIRYSTSPIYSQLLEGLGHHE